MKVAIITYYYNSVNYGGVLQSYALCKKINSMGVECEQIQYDTEPYIKYKRNNQSTAIQVLKRILKKGLRFLFRDRYIKFSEFREKIPHTQQVYNDDNITELSNKYDIVIAGSDQIWNLDWYRPAFYLNFVGSNTKKISYAASLGRSTLTSSEQAFFKETLASFSAISVRESSSAELLNYIAPVKVEPVIDPTLLLSVSEWDKICSKRIISEPYIYCHFIGNGKDERLLAEQFAKKKKLHLVYLKHPSRFNYNDCFVNGKGVSKISPADFISLVKYADYVLTDSFHCCAFSTIYQKQFWVFHRHGKKNMASRVETLLSLINANDHFCNCKELYTVEYLTKTREIDYSNTEGLRSTIQTSIDFLELNIR